MDPIVTIFRFEDEQGFGPWRGWGADAYDEAHRMRDRHHRCSDMPGPLGEPAQTNIHRFFAQAEQKGVEPPHRFGFLSLKQLKKAFPSGVGRAAMGKAGQRLSVYQVPSSDVVTGDSQVAFLKDRARKVGELDMRSLTLIQSNSASIPAASARAAL
jgi:hypothetical protein